MLLATLHVAAIISLLSYERRHPSSTLAWLLALVFVPIGGLVCYLLFGQLRARRVARDYFEAVARIQPVLREHRVFDALVETRGEPIDERTRIMMRLGDRLASTPASAGNDVAVLENARAAYDSIREAIEGARDHVHVEFYIIQPDETGERLRDLLIDRARAGVEVRVLCDGVGSGRLPRDFWDPLVAAGGKAAIFRPVLRILAFLPLRDRVDFRNHRKIVVVDGRIGFTGGINVGREYLGLDPDVGYWRDTHLRIEGPAVLSLQKAFGEDWLHATSELLHDRRYFPAPPPHPLGDYVVSVIDSGPDREFSPIAHLFTQAIALARDRVWITNPYFVPSPAMEHALVGAALRGVDVRLLLPKRSDSALVRLAAESYYSALLDSGVRLYHYARGFVHAKTLVADEWAATVGSANMDVRSFHLNYELNAIVYGREICRELARQFEHDLENAEEVNPSDEQRVRVSRRMLRSAARMMSPLL